MFSLPLAAAGARVTGIDDNRKAIQDAHANVRLNRIADSHVRVILAAGYRVERIEAVDMLPHTDHIETIEPLVKGNSGTEH